MEKVNIFSRFGMAPVIGVLLLAVVGVGALLNSNNNAEKVATEDAVSEIAADEAIASGDASMLMLAPTSQLNTVAEAREAVSFDLLLPGMTVAGEEIIGIEEYDSGNGSALTFKYGTGETIAYRFSVRAVSENYYDETAEIKTFSVGGEETSAYYSYFGEPTDDENAIAYDGGEMARSMLTWDMDGVVYEILEYGEVSETQLIQLAQSLQ